jgi:hypothetical protein
MGSKAWRWTPWFKATSKNKNKYTLTTPIVVTFEVSIQQIEMETARLIYDKYEAFINSGGTESVVVEIAPSDIYDSLRSSYSSTACPWGVTVDLHNEKIANWCEAEAKKVCRKLFPSAYRKMTEE